MALSRPAARRPSGPRRRRPGHLCRLLLQGALRVAAHRLSRGAGRGAGVLPRGPRDIGRPAEPDRPAGAGGLSHRRAFCGVSAPTAAHLSRPAGTGAGRRRAPSRRIARGAARSRRPASDRLSGTGPRPADGRSGGEPPRRRPRHRRAAAVRLLDRAPAAPGADAGLCHAAGSGDRARDRAPRRGAGRVRLQPLCRHPQSRHPRRKPRVQGRRGRGPDFAVWPPGNTGFRRVMHAGREGAWAATVSSPSAGCRLAPALRRNRPAGPSSTSAPPWRRPS